MIRLGVRVTSVTFGWRSRPQIRFNWDELDRFATDPQAFRAVAVHEMAHVRNRDNAPTYLVFANMAASPHPLAWLVENRPALLQAISCGAVFMGANTYIGNAPNFMVKSIAEEAGVKMPSFFGYLLYSGMVLIPLFVVVTILFFR